MTTFATISTILSLALFGGFVLLGFHRFGILSSYSSYARKWETEKKQRIVHVAGAMVCAVLSLLWLCLALRCWIYPVITAAIALIISLMSGTLRRSYVLWGELALFAAVYAVLIAGGF